MKVNFHYSSLEEQKFTLTYKNVDYHITGKWPIKTKYSIKNGALVATTVLPAWQSQLQRAFNSQLDANKRLTAITTAKAIIGRMAITAFREALGISFNSLSAPITMSAEVKPEEAHFTGNSWILNEQFCLDRALDADGDVASIGSNQPITNIKEWLTAGRTQVLSKFPYTSQPPLVKIKIDKVQEKFHQFGIDWIKSNLTTEAITKDGWFQSVGSDNKITIFTPTTIHEQAIAAHSAIDVGKLTNGWNNYEFCEAPKLRSEQERWHFIFSNPERYETLESGGMKVVTKGNTKKLEPPKVLTYQRRLKSPYNLFMLGEGGINSLTPGKVWYVMQELASPENIVKNIFNLTPETMQITGSTFVNGSSEIRIPKPEGNGDLLKLERLQRMGLVNWSEFPHAIISPETAQCCLIHLQRPDGKVVSTPLNKREGFQESSSLTTAFIVPPVYYPTLNKIVSGLQHIAIQLAQLNLRTFPYNLEDFHREDKKTLATTLQAELLRIISSVGRQVPATPITTNKIPLPSSRSLAILTNSLVIYLGVPTPPEFKVDIITNLNTKLEEKYNRTLSLFPIKSSKKEFIRCIFANSTGGNILVSPKCHPKRSVAIMSQLINAADPKEYTVAIIRSNTKHSVLITPTGIEKQIPENNPFYTRVLATQEELLRYNETVEPEHRINPENYSIYTNWLGEDVICWLAPPKSHIKIGKLIAKTGEKFIPREYKQHFFSKGKTTLPIDLLIPYHELADKGCLNYYLDFAEEHVLLDNNQNPVLDEDNNPVHVMIYKADYSRSTNHSENGPPKVGKTTRDGADSFALIASLQKLGLDTIKVDLSQFEGLQSVYQQINKLSGILRLEEHNYEESYEE
jgi:hypothetical protein